MTAHTAQAPPESERVDGANVDPPEAENKKHGEYRAAGAADASQGAERDRVDAADKAIRTLQARAALAGWSAHVIGPDRLMLARWGRSTPDMTLAEAEAFVAGLTRSTP